MSQATLGDEKGKLPIHFLLRRLHSLSGLVPVGMFMCMHLFANFQLLFPGMFQHDVNFIHNLPGLLFLEIAIWSSIGFHAVLGLYYTFVGAKPNAGAYSYSSNWRYVLQRVTGIVALLFIFFHVATLRWGWPIGEYVVPFYAKIQGVDAAEVSVYYAITQHTIVILIYLFSTACCVYHFCNGLWTMGITWGVIISETAQKRWGMACTGIAAVLTVFFVGALIGAARLDPSPTEKQLYEDARDGKILYKGELNDAQQKLVDDAKALDPHYDKDHDDHDGHGH